MIKDDYRRALSQTFESLPDLPIESEWRYAQLAFALKPNTNPRSPISGLLVLNCEKVKQTPKSVIVWPFEQVWRKGKGYLPSFPYRILVAKHSNVKLISKELNSWKSTSSKR